MPRITFVNEKKTIEVEAGANLRKAARQNGVEVYKGMHRTLHCPGLGLCATCKVFIRKGEENVSPPTWRERLSFLNLLSPFAVLFFFNRIGREKKFRLSCQTKVGGDIEVETTPSYNLHGEKFWG